MVYIQWYDWSFSQTNFHIFAPHPCFLFQHFFKHTLWYCTNLIFQLLKLRVQNVCMLNNTVTDILQQFLFLVLFK